MKQRPKGILALCTALLLVLLGGCQGEGRAAFTQDCVLSLQAGSTTAVVSGTRTDGSQAAGETVSLAQPPLVEGETFTPGEDPQIPGFDNVEVVSEDTLYYHEPMVFTKDNVDDYDF